MRGRHRGSSGKFKRSWNIPFLAPSRKEKRLLIVAYVLAMFLSLMGLNDAKRHCESAGHQKKYSELNPILL